MKQKRMLLLPLLVLPRLKKKKETDEEEGENGRRILHLLRLQGLLRLQQKETNGEKENGFSSAYGAAGKRGEKEGRKKGNLLGL